jgi:uncharacterized protein (TIGR02145 family)
VLADSIFAEIELYDPAAGYADIIFQGGTTFRFDADTVMVRGFYSCSNGNNFRTQIFITPGDSVSFRAVFKERTYNWRCLNYYEVIFEGENAAHYNYASEKRKAIPGEEEPNYTPGTYIDLRAYKQQLQAYRDREIEFLNNYRKEHAVSEDFINYALAEINNKYAFKLYQVAYFNKCSLPEGYLDDAIITQNPLAFYYTLEALQFKYVYCSPDVDMERIYNAILDEVHPKFRSKLLSGLIKWFSERGDRVYKKSLLQLMDEIEKTSADSDLLAYVQEYRPYYLLSGTKLPDDILDKTYLRSLQSPEKITLRQFFDNYRNRAIYLDFWASWCAPCRNVNREAGKSKSYFAEKQIAVVYISIDMDKSAWQQASIEDGITSNQYLMLEDNDRPLQDYLKVRGIPRYVLFNKRHEIEMLSAPRPVHCLFEDLKVMIERMQSVNLPDILEEKVVQKPIPQKEVKAEAIQKTDIQTNREQALQKSVLINGVHWASSNVAAPGVFTSSPENAGMLYQWNRKKAWTAVAGSTIRWDVGNTSHRDTWEKVNDPSPEGWRIPTLEEVKMLCDKDKVNSEWTTINGVRGRKFTDKTNGNSIFLPAVGYRRAGSNGALLNAAEFGTYWSNTPSSAQYAEVLHVFKEDANWHNNGYRWDGFPIRPVVE